MIHYIHKGDFLSIPVVKLIAIRGHEMSRLLFGDYILDKQKKEILHKDKSLELEPQIYGILDLLITRHGEIVSHDDIIEAVWERRPVSNNVIGNRINPPELP
jgi:DNA-binding winged helix-turn-helix (wHTH) protein